MKNEDENNKEINQKSSLLDNMDINSLSSDIDLKKK